VKKLSGDGTQQDGKAAAEKRRPRPGGLCHPLSKGLTMLSSDGGVEYTLTVV
jgi:hypothetical protein